MPKKLEQKLKREAAQKGLTDKSADAYVYGTLRKTGWVPERERRGHPQRKATGGKVERPSTKW